MSVWAFPPGQEDDDYRLPRPTPIYPPPIDPVTPKVTPPEPLAPPKIDPNCYICLAPTEMVQAYDFYVISFCKRCHESLLRP